MRKTTFEWHNAVFEVQEDTVSTDIDANYVANLVFPGARTDREYRHDLEYGATLATVRVLSGDPGFTLPSLDNPEAIRAFYPVLEGLPRDFRSLILIAKASLRTPANDSDLAPGIDPNVEASESTDASGSSNSDPLTEPSSLSLAAD